MKKTGNYFYPETDKRKLRLEKLNYSLSLLPGPSLFSTMKSSLLISFVFPRDCLSHAQFICLPVFLTQLPGAAPARIYTAVCSASG